MRVVHGGRDGWFWAHVAYNNGYHDDRAGMVADALCCFGLNLSIVGAITEAARRGFRHGQLDVLSSMGERKEMAS